MNLIKSVKKYIPKGIKYKLNLIKTNYFNGFVLHSYSQEGEDMILKRMFENKENGFFVDVGAHHPFRFSNTYFFYKKGWNGINIDAMPGSMQLFDKFRKRDINLEMGISDKQGSLEYFMFNEPALNGFSRELSEYRREDTKEKYFIKSTVNIKVFPLSEILSKHMPEYKNIDFLSIDVEGLDLDVLKSNDWVKFRPKVILVEILKSNLLNLHENEIVVYLASKNYKPFAKTFNTMFFIEK